MGRFVKLIVGWCVAVMATSAAVRAEDASGTLVEFRSGHTMLRGLIYKPQGKGPFPAVVFERAANVDIGQNAMLNSTLASLYTSHGYVFFITSRRTDDQLKAEVEGIETAKHSNRRPESLPEFENLTKDVGAAVNWVKVQPYVDETRVAVVGYETGGTASLLAAEQQIGVRAFVVFSPSAHHWKDHPELGGALSDAVKEAKAPIFLIQAQNDYTLAPSEQLGRAINAKGKPNLCKVYPPFGTSNHEGNKFAHTGTTVWGEDVFSFLQQALN